MDRHASVSVGIRVALIQVNMRTETEQQSTTGMLDLSQVQVHVKTDRAAFERLKTRACVQPE